MGALGGRAQGTRTRPLLLRWQPSDTAEYLAQSIRWFVLYPKVPSSRSPVEWWIRAGKAEARAQFVPIRPVRLAR